MEDPISQREPEAVTRRIDTAASSTTSAPGHGSLPRSRAIADRMSLGRP